MTSTSTPSAAPRAGGSSGFYALAWRWHFYAGLCVIPFLLMLALTGLVMVYFTGFQSRLGNVVHVTPRAPILAVTAQARAALRSHPGAQLKAWMSPRAADVASEFELLHQGSTLSVAVNPYTGDVLRTVDKEHTIYAWAEKIHGTLLIGDLGDRLIEVAAGLAIVMIITGLYLFWPRGSTRWGEVLAPDLRAGGRKFWKSLHSSIGFWTSAVLLLFLLSGMAWTGIWGGKVVQPWSSFPAEKWDAVPKSDATHAALNTPGLHEVPWGLEQTPLPLSGSAAGAPGIPAGTPVNLDSVAAFAHQIGLRGQFNIAVPQDATGVYSISADSMHGDLSDPTQDRFVHLDRYTGRVLGQATFADYAPLAKAMAVGIALHQGDLGWWSALLNVAFCLGIVLLCVSGVWMWWRRRPQSAGRLGAPSVPAQAAFWKGGAVVMLLSALAFPLAGGALLVVLLLDGLLISRLPALKARLS